MISTKRNVIIKCQFFIFAITFFAMFLVFSGNILRWNDNALEDPLNSGNYVINISHIQKLSDI